MKFGNLKVATRLVWSFGSLIALMAIIVVAGLHGLSRVDTSIGTLTQNRMPKVDRLNDIAYRTMGNARVVRNIVLQSDEKAMAANKALYEKNGAAIDEHVAYLREHFTSPSDKEGLKAMVDARDAFRAYTKQVLELGLANKGEEATKVLYGEGYKTQAAYFAAVKTLVDAQKQEMEAVGLDAIAASTSGDAAPQLAIAGGAAGDWKEF